jgi:glycosyltransferase involved in cell wall biosynthesis
MELPLVTIAIPCLNEGDIIKRAFLSCRNQTYKNIEIILSDAGSNNDKTLQFLKDAEAMSNVKVLYHTNGTSKYDNWTAMVTASKGKYILILPARHILYPEGIARLVKPFKKNHDIGYVRGCMVYEESDGKKSKLIPADFSSLVDSATELKKLLIGNTCEVITTLYDLEKLKKSLPFNTNFERTFVWLQNAKIASKWPVYFVNADIGQWTNWETPEQLIQKANLATAELPALFDAIVALVTNIKNSPNKLSEINNTVVTHKTINRNSFKLIFKNILSKSFFQSFLIYFKQVVFRFIPSILGR